VSKNDNSHGTDTTKVAVKVMGRNAEQESLESTSENRHRRCGLDMLGQTVPSTGSSNC